MCRKRSYTFYVRPNEILQNRFFIRLKACQTESTAQSILYQKGC